MFRVDMRRPINSFGLLRPNIGTPKFFEYYVDWLVKFLF